MPTLEKKCNSHNKMKREFILKNAIDGLLDWRSIWVYDKGVII